MINPILKDLFSGDKYSYLRPAILIILLGFAIRLFSFHYTYIINPDGVLYIHQARAIYYGLKDSILTCSMGYLSNYSILIVLGYKIFGDWEVAAKSVSLFFGTITLVPLYFLLDRFFRKEITLLATLAFALIPVFVDKSVDVVRDPVYWFFSVLGLYLFVSQIEKRNYRYLILSSLCFLMAAWARIEAILFVLVSLIYILFVSQDRKIQKTSIFAMPVVLVLLLGMFGSMIFHMPTSDFHRGYEVTTKFSAPIIEYKNLRQSLAELMNQPLDHNLPGFLHKARHLVWLIALGTLVKYAVAAFFYPLFFIFIIGFGGILTRIKEDRRILYLGLIAASGLLLLYLHVLQTWMMYNRFWAIFILPFFIVIGFGLEKINVFLRSKFNLRESVALSILCLLILTSSLPKNLKTRETDKLVFKEIGELVAEREGNDKEIKVATSTHSIRWISFYANLNYKGAPCPEENYDLENIIGKGYEEFVKNLKRRGIRYLLWEEKHWPKQGSYVLDTGNMKDFVRLGAWSHPDTGSLILFEVI
ncbi:MAG TPA: glycosyltransferase family 39 protein [Desulfatiglandales bacterium]|nr:glycosyltransferase family 39 protein [Desulfatiglandales bacterium]